jgi:hypothetical protein
LGIAAPRRGCAPRPACGPTTDREAGRSCLVPHRWLAVVVLALDPPCIVQDVGSHGEGLARRAVHRQHCPGYGGSPVTPLRQKACPAPAAEAMPRLWISQEPAPCVSIPSFNTSLNGFLLTLGPGHRKHGMNMQVIASPDSENRSPMGGCSAAVPAEDLSMDGFLGCDGVRGRWPSLLGGGQCPVGPPGAVSCGDRIPGLPGGDMACSCRKIAAAMMVRAWVRVSLLCSLLVRCW